MEVKPIVTPQEADALYHPSEAPASRVGAPQLAAPLRLRDQPRQTTDAPCIQTPPGAPCLSSALLPGRASPPVPIDLMRARTKPRDGHHFAQVCRGLLSFRRPAKLIHCFLDECVSPLELPCELLS